MKITVNGKAFDCPGSWGEVTYRQFLKLAEAGDDTPKILSVFTGIDAETIRSARLKNYDLVESQLSFLHNSKMNLEIPSKILGYKVPHNLELEAIGQYEDAKLLFKDCPDGEQLNRYPDLVATFVNPKYIDSTDEEKDEFAKKFWDAPCEEVMGIGNFFLAKRIGLRLNLGKSYLRRNTPLKRFKLALTNLLARMGFTVRFFLWKRKHRITGMS